MKFECDCCGECCRNIRLSGIANELDRGDGVCKYLKDNLCSIYTERPIICNVDRYYDKYLIGKISREEFHKLNKKACEKLKKI